MKSRFLLPMLIVCVFVAQQAFAQTASGVQSDISRKLALGAAKGELTNAQVIVFRDRVRDVLRAGSAQSQEQKLTAIAQQIDRARNAKRSLASKYLPWF